MTMLDKCAKTQLENPETWEYLSEDWRDGWRQRVRAVLEALRDPTPEMVEAGKLLLAGNFETNSSKARNLFTAMIDEALKERT